MRALIFALALLSMVAAPVLAAWPDACAHEAPSMSGGDLHVGMVMEGEAAERAPCHCDPGCAEHCDAVAPAALPGTGPVIHSVPAPISSVSTARTFHVDPPPGAPLRPPQVRNR